MKIYQEGEHKALRTKSALVKKADFGSQNLKNEIEAMFKLLSNESDGVAIAAPQIGIEKQIFVISEEIYQPLKSSELVYINPKITKLFGEQKYLEEGCLSVRWLYGKVMRYTKVSISAYDENGRKFEKTATGLLAHIFQHEVDHLNATLFIDKAVNVEKLSDENIKKIKNK